MILYLDTSSLVKLYVEEDGSEQVEREVDEVDRVATSRMTYAEARSAFARGRREVSQGQRHRLRRKRGPGDTEVDMEISYGQILRDFQRDWRHYAKVNVSSSLIRLAGDLAERHALRGYDAVHLASAMVLRDRIPDIVAFSTWDGNLSEAAVTEGLQRAH